MENNQSNNRFSLKLEIKGSPFQAQMEQVYKAFEHPSTMLMIAKKTGIERANICRFIATCEKADKIKFLGLGVCKISKNIAGFYSTGEIFTY